MVEHAAPSVGGAFALVNHHGEKVTDRTYLGIHLLVFFGFTNCRTVCPRTLTKISAVLKRLGNQSERVRALYITVDPERDSPEVMADYLSTYHPGIVGLTGTSQQVRNVGANYRVFSERRTPSRPDGSYDVAHTSLIYLIGPDGRHRSHLTNSASEDAILERLVENLSRTEVPGQGVETELPAVVGDDACCH